MFNILSNKGYVNQSDIAIDIHIDTHIYAFTYKTHISTYIHIYPIYLYIQ
jgi:hypothetical protein